MDLGQPSSTTSGATTPICASFYRDQQAYAQNPVGFGKAFKLMAKTKWMSVGRPIGEKSAQVKDEWKAVVIAAHINPYRKITQPYADEDFVKLHAPKIAFYDTRAQVGEE